jgi:hypothetical protein
MPNSIPVAKDLFNPILPAPLSQARVDEDFYNSDINSELEEQLDLMIKSDAEQHAAELLRFIDSELAKLLLEAPIKD